MKRVLVTGASGFVGANLARRLLRDGHDLHLLVRSDHAAWRLEGLRRDAALHLVALEDREAVTRVVGEVRPEWIFHLAAHGAYSWQTDLEQIAATNLHGTMNLVSAGLHSGFEAFVNTGSSSEYGFKDHAPAESEALEPNSHYAVTKAAATLFARYTAQSRGVHLPTLRLYSVYGPYEDPQRLVPTLIQQGLLGKLPPLVDPNVSRDFVHVDDVVDAYLLAARTPTSELGAIYNVGTGVATTIGEAVSVARRVLQIAAEPEWSTMPNRSWDTSVWISDARKIRGQLGWEPRHDFASGFAQTVDWFRETPSSPRSARPEPDPPSPFAGPLAAAPAPRTPEGSFSLASWSTMALLVALFAGVLIGRIPLHHDLAAHLDWLHRMLSGERLYADILELNPPLIFYLYYPPALFAHLLGASAIVSLQIYIVLITSFALFMSHQVMRAVRFPEQPGDRQVLLFALLLVLAFLRPTEVGQREHWAFAFACPYWLAAAARAEGRGLAGWRAWVVGLMAGVAFSVKPLFVVVPLLTEAYLFVRHGQRSAWHRLECRVAIGFGLAYAAWVIAGTDYLRVARIAAALYPAYGGGIGSVVAAASPGVWGVILLLLSLFRFERSQRPFVALLILASLGFFLCALIQAKGWSYHLYPVSAGAILILLLFGWTVFSASGSDRKLVRVPPARRPAVFSGIVTAAMIGLAALWWPAWDSPSAQSMRALADVVRHHAKGRPVAWFSTDAYPTFPALAYARAHSALPIALWPIPGLYHGVASNADPFPYHAWEEMEDVERSIVVGIEHAFVDETPALVVFDRRAYKQGLGNTKFDFEEYLQRLPALAAQMQRYEPLGEVGPWRFYERKGAPEAH